MLWVGHAPLVQLFFKELADKGNHNLNILSILSLSSDNIFLPISFVVEA